MCVLQLCALEATVGVRQEQPDGPDFPVYRGKSKEDDTGNILIFIVHVDSKITFFERLQVMVPHDMPPLLVAPVWPNE